MAARVAREIRRAPHARRAASHRNVDTRCTCCPLPERHTPTTPRGRGVASGMTSAAPQRTTHRRHRADPSARAPPRPNAGSPSQSAHAATAVAATTSAVRPPNYPVPAWPPVEARAAPDAAAAAARRRDHRTPLRTFPLAPRSTAAPARGSRGRRARWRRARRCSPHPPRQSARLRKRRPARGRYACNPLHWCDRRNGSGTNRRRPERGPRARHAHCAQRRRVRARFRAAPYVESRGPQRPPTAPGASSARPPHPRRPHGGASTARSRPALDPRRPLPSGTVFPPAGVATRPPAQPASEWHTLQAGETPRLARAPLRALRHCRDDRPCSWSRARAADEAATAVRQMSNVFATQARGQRNEAE